MKRVGTFLLTFVLLLGVLPAGLVVKADATGNLVDPSGLTPEIAKAYLGVIDDMIDEYGGYASYHGEYGYGSDELKSIKDYSDGFFGGFLKDIDSNGIPELLVIGFYEGYAAPAALYTWSNELVCLYDWEFMAWSINDQTAIYLAVKEGQTYFVTHDGGGQGGYWSSITTYNAIRGNELQAVYETGREEAIGAMSNKSSLSSLEDNYVDFSYEYIDDDTYVVEGFAGFITENGQTRQYGSEDYETAIGRWSAGIEWLTLVDEGTGYMYTDLDSNGKELRKALYNAANAASGDTGEATSSMSYLGGVIPYYGDASKMKLSAEVAEAYAELIRGEYWDKGRVHVAMFDGGNGVPMIWIASGNGGTESYIEENWGDWVYTCTDGQVQESNKWISALVRPGENGIVTQEREHMVSDFATNYACLRLSNGRVADTPFATGTWDPLNASLTGDDIDEKWEEFVAEMGGELDYLISATTGLSGFLHLTGEWCDGSDAMLALEQYANEVAAGSAYSFPKAESVDEEALVEAIARAVAEDVGGEISGIYKLADGVYYVTITVDGSTHGTLVLGSRENGKVVWNVSQPDTEPLSEEELKAILAEIQSSSNLSLDFSAISGISTADAIKSIREQLDNMSGLMPTDPAKAELADYIQSAISSSSTITLSGGDNRFVPEPDEVAALRSKAEKAKSEYEKLLEEYDITLNRAITIIIRIVWNNMDSGAPCQIELNEQLISALKGCEMQLLLGDTRHYVRLSADTLRTLVDLYGCVKVQMAVESDGIYTINFLDENDRIIERLDASVGFGLPAETSLTTVVVSYEGGSLNWGGQYDPNSRVISFDASYSGRYEIIENAAEIDDISELDEDTRAAIAFLVSKGYMSLEGNSFLPDVKLNRYQFAQALVGMFFALDQNQLTSFVDVPADSPYYPYVASGESLDVIKGYEDNRFGGENGITIEQMLALAARTLIQYKGYSEPTTPSDYLNSFSDGHEVSDWAQSQVALAVREGLIDRGDELRPADIVTRGEAALILYRLFLLLHEVPVAELELPEVSEVEENDEPPIVEGDKVDTEGSVGSTGTVIAIIIILAGAGGGAGWWLLKKKKEQNRE